MTVGLFTTALFVGHLLAQIPSGLAIDALGARRVGFAALLWIAACNTVLLASPSPALALTIRAVAGLGTGAVFVAGSDYARSARTPIAQGLFGGASIAGSGLAAARPLLAGSLAAGAAGTAVLAAFTSLPLALAFAAALVAGAAAGLPFAAVFTAAQRLRRDAPGAAVGLVNGVAVVVILAGTPLAGLAFSLPGDGRIGFAVLAALWAAALLSLPKREEL